jgi:hypothetical protein
MSPVKVPDVPPKGPLAADIQRALPINNFAILLGGASAIDIPVLT